MRQIIYPRLRTAVSSLARNTYEASFETNAVCDRAYVYACVASLVVTPPACPAHRPQRADLRKGRRRRERGVYLGSLYVGGATGSSPACRSVRPNSTAGARKPMLRNGPGAAPSTSAQTMALICRECVKAAQGIRGRLADLGLAMFAMLSGGKCVPATTGRGKRMSRAASPRR